MRAWHLIGDGTPKIFEDDLGMALVCPKRPSVVCLGGGYEGRAASARVLSDR